MLAGISSLDNQPKGWRRTEEKMTKCEPYGEYLAKAALTSNDWTYHHDAIDVYKSMTLRKNRP